MATDFNNQSFSSRLYSLDFLTSYTQNNGEFTFSINTVATGTRLPAAGLKTVAEIHFREDATKSVKFEMGLGVANPSGTINAGISKGPRMIVLTVWYENAEGTMVDIEGVRSYDVETEIIDPIGPTNFTYNPASDFVNTLTLSWSGQQADEQNPITGYEIITYRSDNGDDWTELSRVTQISTSRLILTPPDVCYYGQYLRFGIIAVGLYSESEIVYSPKIRKRNWENAIAPSEFSTNYDEGTIQSTIILTWNAGTAGYNNAITNYVLHCFESDAIDGTYTLAKNITILPNAESYTLSLPENFDRGKYLYFTMDMNTVHETLALEVPTKSIKVNSTPNQPVLIYPKSSTAVSYNDNAYIRLQAGTDDDGSEQKYQIKNNNTIVNNIEYLGTAEFYGNGLFAAKTGDEVEWSESTTYQITTIDTPWGKGNRLSRGSVVHATDLTQLRECCETLSLYYDLTLPPWVDETIVAGVTIVKAEHFKQIQKFLKRIFAITGNSVTLSTIERNVQINHNHINELRNAIETIC